MVSVIEANIDDSSPQVLGYALERLMEAGALDVSLSPLQMKKNRPGSLLRVIARPEDQERLAQMIFAETSTLGLRIHAAERRVEERRIVEVETPWGTVRGKVSGHGTGQECLRPEYDDCRALAERTRDATQAGAGGGAGSLHEERNEILSHDTDLLHQCRAAHRPRLYHHRGRHHPPVEGNAGLRRRPRHRHRRAWPEVERAAAAAGKTPQEFTDVISEEFRQQWEISGPGHRPLSSAPPAPVTPRWCRICSCAASRTAMSTRATTPDNTASSTNAYVNDAKPGDPCPDCGRPTETVTEENYYFKLSAFQDRLLDLYT